MESQVAIQVGDLLVLYTDGLTEAVNESIKEFGVQRLIDVVQTNLDCSPETIIARIMAAVASFVGAQPAYDDATVVIARRVT